ncbi:DUF5994 family protein [Embleya sp. NPDC008237]|uniref:DUF5994 family protein n=1 Tax=Embleya sp. NPDC008237 TaxID=3363978 RepID=UPI0036EBF251
MAPPARLSLFTHAGGRSDELDGVWWPHSRATVEELAALFTGMERVGSYSRATLDRSLWPGVPRPFRIAGLDRVVRWGGFVAGQDPHRVELFSLVDPFRELLVVPPETSPRVAAHLMNMSGPCDGSRSPTELLCDALEWAAESEVGRSSSRGCGEPDGAAARRVPGRRHPHGGCMQRGTSPRIVHDAGAGAGP